MNTPSWLRHGVTTDAGQHASMPAESGWTVLLVDDDPEIHEVTRMVLADATFANRPIGLASAFSAAEAKAYLATHPDTALILLDVVMEADHAGLELVRHTREIIRNRDVQIVLRTGQPGMAPERDVIVQYDINGYFLKTELTAQKLTSIVVAGLRAYQYIKALQPGHASQASSSTRSLVEPKELARRARIAADLAAAAQTGLVGLQALPQVELASGAVVGVEIQPAWTTREGALRPVDIVALTDDAALHLSLDTLLLRRACGLACDWRDSKTDAPRVSVPLLSTRLDDVELTALVKRCLDDAGLNGTALDLQLSGAVLHKTRAAARALQAEGVSITLVDFGPELISLSGLHRLGPDRIKIHPTFVRDVTHEPERAAVARSIVALAHTLGMSAIADGIASDDDLQFFRWEGCDFGQGDALAAAWPL
jgi:EAL domain-containing protein (putative c-di-GMP-specific phosphodiesterase class I)/DNA-binding NarL/FixJ family response regulator